jgi:hypothetical protein
LALQETGGRVHDIGVCAAVGQRSPGAEASDRRVDETRVVSSQLSGPQPEPLHHAGTKVLDEYIGLRGEAAADVYAFGFRQIDGDAALAAVLLAEERSETVAFLSPPARTVAGRRLDLDDVGAEVGEHPRAMRAGHIPAEVNDTDTVECPRHQAFPIPTTSEHPRWMSCIAAYELGASPALTALPRSSSEEESFLHLPSAEAALRMWSMARSRDEARARPFSGVPGVVAP